MTIQHPPTSRRIGTLLVLAAAAAAACRSTHHRYAFEPTPMSVSIEPAGLQVARALMTIVEGAQEEADERPVMHVRVRIENRDDAPVKLDREGMQLVGSDLRSFGSPTIEPDPMPLLPGRTETYELYFPFPDDVPLDAPLLEGLSLSWSLLYEGGRAEVNADFVRAWPDRVHGPRASWSFGLFHSG